MRNPDECRSSHIHKLSPNVPFFWRRQFLTDSCARRRLTGPYWCHRNLNYYFRKEPKECLEMCAALGIRFRPKTKVRGREQVRKCFSASFTLGRERVRRASTPRDPATCPALFAVFWLFSFCPVLFGGRFFLFFVELCWGPIFFTNVLLEEEARSLSKSDVYYLFIHMCVCFTNTRKGVGRGLSWRFIPTRVVFPVPRKKETLRQQSTELEHLLFRLDNPWFLSYIYTNALSVFAVFTQPLRVPCPPHSSSTHVPPSLAISPPLSLSVTRRTRTPSRRSATSAARRCSTRGESTTGRSSRSRSWPPGRPRVTTNDLVVVEISSVFVCHGFEFHGLSIKSDSELEQARKRERELKGARPTNARDEPRDSCSNLEESKLRHRLVWR